MVDVVHTSDWHLGFLHGKHPKPVSTLMQEIVKPCKYASENGIQHVIVSGDICHSYIMSPDVQRAIYRLADKYKDLMFWMIPGNHDYHSKNVTSLEALFETTRRYDNLRIILQPSVEQLDGVPFTFLPFPYVERVLDTQSVLVSHLTPSGAKYENGKTATKGTTAIDSEAGFWLNGHLHLAQETNYYSCCGTLYPVRFGAEPRHGFTHLSFDYSEGEINATVESRVATRSSLKMCKLRITDAAEFQSLEHDPNTLYSLQVCSGIIVPQQQLRTYSNILEIVPEGGTKRQDSDAKVVVHQRHMSDAELLEDFFVAEHVPQDVRATARQLDAAFRSALQGKTQQRVYACSE